MTKQRLTLTALTLLASLSYASAVTLPATTCTKAGDKRCTIDSANLGKIGSGLPFDLGGYTRIGSGFVDPAENAVYVPVEQGSQEDRQGAIYKVDLATGNRTIISGYDGEEWHGNGVDYIDSNGAKSTAYDLGRVEVVRPGPSGSLLALVDKGLSHRTEIIRIDRKTGDRTLVWASKVFDDSAREGPTSIRTIEAQRFNVSSTTLCEGGQGQRMVGLKPSETFETDGKNIYLFMPNQPGGSGIGLISVPLTGGKCTWVSQYWPDGTSTAGSGPTINTLSPLVFASALTEGKFFAATGPNPGGNILFSVDLATGQRATVSALSENNPARRKGEGDSPLGFRHRMGLIDDTLLTLGVDSNDDAFDPVAVDIHNGERLALEARSGTLKIGADQFINVVAGIPGTVKFVIYFKGALHIYDAETGDSYVLSQ